MDSNFVSCILSKSFNFCAQINDALTFNTEAKKTTMIMLISLSKNILPAHFYGWTSHLPTIRTKESNKKDYKSKTLSSPNAILSSHVSSFSLNLYQLNPHATLSSSFRISKWPDPNTMFNPTLPYFTLSYITTSLVPPRRFQAQWTVLVVNFVLCVQFDF